ncbi:MAG: glycosyl hydrolase, partial [Flavobacteriaceae bacterium]|nr:glycosyl hydrolase [Flavobacteriaceae bacterium]
NLLFAATEYGVYMTQDGGQKWTQLKSGMPTIAIRDITIQRRENDLVAASFGRGFYVLDDMSPLRNYTVTAGQEASLFDVKPAYWYVENDEIYGQGNAEYTAKNPPYGAVFTYHLKDSIASLTSQRKMSEKDKTTVPFPGWDALEKEKLQEKPAIWFTVKDAQGQVVDMVKGKNKKGFNRVSWGLSVADRSGVPLKAPPPSDDFFSWGIKATPGDYTVTMSKVVDGQETVLAGPNSFKVVPLAKGALQGASFDDIAAFRKTFEGFQQEMSAVQDVLDKNKQKINAMQRALTKATNPTAALANRLHEARATLLAIHTELNGNQAKAEIGERTKPNPNSGGFIGFVALGTSTYGPTDNHKAALNVASTQLQAIKGKLNSFVSQEMPGLESALKAAGAPWIEGQGLKN